MYGPWNDGGQAGQVPSDVPESEIFPDDIPESLLI
jgi:hypothetical protein